MSVCVYWQTAPGHRNSACHRSSGQAVHHTLLSKKVGGTLRMDLRKVLRNLAKVKEFADHLPGMVLKPF